ncbi:hypothetical protein [Sulfodiicoccus acidiphilus]|nr:hypothetical protein [Sulfodiicoccus acidiphilus]
MWILITMKFGILLLALISLSLPTSTFLYQQLFYSTTTIVTVVGHGRETIYYNVTRSHVTGSELHFTLAVGGPDSVIVTQVIDGSHKVNVNLPAHAGVNNYSLSVGSPMFGTANLTLSNGLTLQLNLTQVVWVNRTVD